VKRRQVVPLLPSSPWHLATALFFSLVLIVAVPALCSSVERNKDLEPGAGHSSTAAPETIPAQTVPNAIPLASVAIKAVELSEKIRSFSEKGAIDHRIDSIQQAFPAAIDQASEALTTTTRILGRRVDLSTLQAYQRQWQRIQGTYADWLTLLTQRSTQLQYNLQRMDELEKSWLLTFEAAQASKDSVLNIQQIKESLRSIHNIQPSLQERLAQVLSLQSQVGDELAKARKVLAQISQAQETAVARIFEIDSPPLWSSASWKEALKLKPVHIRNAIGQYLVDYRAYHQRTSNLFFLQAGIFAFLALLFVAARHQTRLWSLAENAFSPAIKVFRHPFAAALAITLFVVTSPAWILLPPTVHGIYQVILLVPMFILIRTFITKRLSYGILVLVVLYTLDTIRALLIDNQLAIGQIVLTIESIAGMFLVIWLRRNLRHPFVIFLEGSRGRMVESGALLITVALAIGSAAAILGRLGLATLITPGIIASGALALTLAALIRIFIGVIALTFQLWPLKSLRMIQYHRRLLEKRLHRLLIFAAVFGLIARYLSHIGLLAPIQEIGRFLLDLKLDYGLIDISLGSVIEFVLTVVAAYLLSLFIRFILCEDVYPRLGITQGSSYAFSSLLHYFILASGLIFAMAAMGMDLTKLTVLTGAFGIGIGFGLQSVVNNFVSGLILLFERPIHVGDTIEMGELQAKVRSIGIRASTVSTLQGADIIVPNSQLVSEKVTNWTLRNQRRRIDLPVGINYGADPEAVIQMLKGVALANPNVLREPPPRALMTGYGDSSINFELRTWTEEFENWPSVKSELAVAVYYAVQKKDMNFPFPQREVLLLNKKKDDLC
jgi:small-conductance mechanosensitive channel